MHELQRKKQIKGRCNWKQTDKSYGKENKDITEERQPTQYSLQVHL